jgi:hypothetical protein
MNRHFDVQAPHSEYEDLLREAMSMPKETIGQRLNLLRNLSDDPNESIDTAGMLLEISALEHALEQKK